MKRFAELSGGQRAIEVVRWMCVLPAAILTSRLPYLIFWLLMPPAMARLPGTPKPPPLPDWQRMLIPWLLALLTAPGFVLIGSLVAPRHRRYVAIVLAILATLHAFLYHVVIHLPGTPHYTHFVAAVLAAASSAGLMWYFDRQASTGNRTGQSPFALH
jgi:hypothetical protein